MLLKLNELTPNQFASWNRNGYVTLSGFFAKEQIAAINAYVDSLWDKTVPEIQRLVIDIFVGTPQERRIFMRDAPQNVRKAPYKLNDLYLESDLVRQIVLDEKTGRDRGGPAWWRSAGVQYA